LLTSAKSNPEKWGDNFINNLSATYFPGLVPENAISARFCVFLFLKMRKTELFYVIYRL
jgi:hypothetical protein